ncbi:uncharacterized protein LOC143049518 [Mytilus galloprovincialis]|uniref:uncharacterized protein LOC143049518 n=1 Tax=Mytilus galloprovincialis TaxID=29158 RepID=UPI003F7C4302
MYYSNFKGKNHPVALHLSEDELKEMLQSLFPKLMNKTFNLYTQNQRRKLTEAPFHPQHFKDLKYQGVVIIKIQDATGNLVNPTNSLTVPTSTAALATSTQPSTSRPVSVSTPARPVPISTPARPVPVSTPARPVPVSTPARPVPVSTPARPVPVSTPARPVPVSTTATPVLAPSPTTTEHELTQATPNHQTWISSGTPVVTFNPRQHLVNEQDIDFASSLAADREKEESRQAARARRTLERTERTRQREQRKEAIEQLQIKAVGDLHILFITSLAEDHVSLVFVLPDQTVLEKTVSKKTSSETLHLYVEACTDVVLAKLVYCGQLLVREDSTIESLGITGNSRIIVEENLEEILDDSSSEEEPEDSEPINLLNVNDLTDLETRRDRIQEGLLPAINVTIRREDIIEDVLTTYREHPDIIHHHINCTFVGEENALDLEGVTREMFSVFFMAVIMKFFIGNLHKLPRVDARTLFNGTLQLIGKIISHAYVLCNYLPQGISPLLYIFAGNGIYTDELLLQTFSSFITETDSNLVNHLLSNTNWEGLHAEIVNLISTYGGFEVPTKTNVKQTILDLAKINMTVIPCVPISKIKVGMDCYHLLWNGVTEHVIINLMNQYKPTHLKVINLISYTTSDDPTLCSLEEKVKTYFERFIRSLSNQQLLHFLKFWTSSDILCIPRLYVSFNSTQGFNRRPIANTCSATLQISRFYFSADELIEEFNMYLSHSSSAMFDSI